MSRDMPNTRLESAGIHPQQRFKIKVRRLERELDALKKENKILKQNKRKLKEAFSKVLDKVLQGRNE